MSSLNIIDVWIDGKIEYLKMKRSPSLDDAIKVQAQIDILKELQSFCDTLEDDPDTFPRTAQTTYPKEENTYDDPRYMDSMWEK